MPTEFALKNPHLGSNDHLYHLGLSSNDDLSSSYGDVKFVCLGGKASRMKGFAEYMYEELGRPRNSLLVTGSTENGKKLLNIAESAGRYSMYKVGSVLILSHGIGMASLSVLLNELFKLLHYAKCQNDIEVIRMGSCGGLGVEPGTLVITNQPYSSTLSTNFAHVALGKVNSQVCKTSPEMREKLIESAKACNIPAVIGNTMATDDFFEGQCRLDGAFCDYGENDKMEFLRRAHDKCGIRNIEMESTCLSAMCTKAGVKCAVVCVAFVNRLQTDHVEDAPEKFAQWQEQLFVLLCDYIKKTNKGN